MRALALVLLALAAPARAFGQTDAGAPVAPLAPRTADPLPDAGAPQPDPPDPLDDPASPEDDQAARSALGPDDGPPEPRDPVAEEAERTGPFEGSALPDTPAAATEIAALSGRACLRALVRARVPFERVRHAVPGVGTPVRITGALRGVTYRASSGHDPGELMDCHLAVALTRFSTLLRSMGVREVRHLSIYRAPSARAAARHPILAQHPGAMAIDAAVFIRDDGQTYVVERDFHGRRHRPVCGPTARVPTSHAARFLRSVVCDAARRGYFHVLLTPNFNHPHRNHFHLEVSRNVSWQFVR